MFQVRIECLPFHRDIQHSRRVNEIHTHRVGHLPEEYPEP